MERVEKFLKEAETYYLATVEGDQPRVRPFGTAHIFEGRLYIQTGKVKGISDWLRDHSLYSYGCLLYHLLLQYLCCYHGNSLRYIP